ncbi:MAG: response regulator transcription factor [Myxococcaceae bacterium]|nr:response regulator transcription factor [Myxococcaceae bacterium]MBH2006340.1 response regulator transcription factor [Myxococcaceae bacterium]
MGGKLKITSRNKEGTEIRIEAPADMSGIDLCRWCKTKYPEIEILMLTVSDDKTHVLETIQKGAVGYLVKGISEAKLSEREQECLQMVAKGLSNHEAASVMGLSRATIRTHLEHIYQKLDVCNRVEAVTEGLRQGIIAI